MKFTNEADVNGTCLQGKMPAYFHQLVEVFGEPEGGGDKTTVEWCLEFEDGTIATIYDWKEYETPMGLYQWHIGGRNKDAVYAVMDAFKQGATV
jgi:hypothetical protein